jgi:hypothetical protein
MQDALDKEGLFISNVKLKPVNFAKKHQGRVNEYMASHNNATPTFDLKKSLGIEESKEIKVPVSASIQKATSNSIMQTSQKKPSVEDFSICKVCQKRNAKGAKICINCGSKFD